MKVLTPESIKNWGQENLPNDINHTMGFACMDGYVVGHPWDASPRLCNVDTGDLKRWPLYKTVDKGETWLHVASFVMNEMGDFTRIEWL